MKIKRWVQASLVAATALLGAAALAPAAQAGSTTVLGNPRLNLPVTHEQHTNVHGTAVFGNHTTQEISLYSLLNTVTYSLPGDLPVAPPINAEVAEARQTAMRKLAKLANKVMFGSLGPSDFEAYEKYLEVVDAAEIAYEAALREARSPEALAMAMQQAIGHGRGNGTIAGTQTLAHNMWVSSTLPFRPAGDAYITAVSQ